MGSKRGDKNGLNDRFDSRRNKGYDGATGYNEFPRQDQVTWVAADPAGNYNTTEQLLIGTRVAQIRIVVTEVFNNIPTLTVGTDTDPDQFVTLADAVDLTTLGTTVIPAPEGAEAFTATGVFRAVIGGTPDQGSATITAEYEV